MKLAPETIKLINQAKDAIEFYTKTYKKKPRVVDIQDILVDKKVLKKIAYDYRHLVLVISKARKHGLISFDEILHTRQKPVKRIV